MAHMNLSYFMAFALRCIATRSEPEGLWCLRFGFREGQKILHHRFGFPKVFITANPKL